MHNLMQCRKCLAWQPPAAFIDPTSRHKCIKCRRAERYSFHESEGRYRQRGRWPRHGNTPPPYRANTPAYTQWKRAVQQAFVESGEQDWGAWFHRAKEQARADPEQAARMVTSDLAAYAPKSRNN